MASDGQRIIHRRLSRDYSDSSDDSDDNASVKKAPVTSSMTSASQVTSAKVPEKNGLVLKPSLSLEPYDVAFKKAMKYEKYINIFNLEGCILTELE
ncbi:hypothetical protein TNCT_665131 [Trichonephila clavata]|uniref:Uncharacterized protein n=1 Tax=Trichonephila clavata TaxID=2740835 RepID=A0A8X6LUI1_TRICU|nr:hypothetical protein TNCT_665131 [Trichonephila clavata]